MAPVQLEIRSHRDAQRIGKMRRHFVPWKRRKQDEKSGLRMDPRVRPRGAEERGVEARIEKAEDVLLLPPIQA